MIEGIETHDVLRMEELGVDTCYDLATADFVPLLLKTPYSGRQLIDWILQAKLCVYFGENVKELRRYGIRTLIDLEALSPEEIETLPHDTSVTTNVLTRAIASVRNNPEIARLREVGQLLGMFWGRPEQAASTLVNERQHGKREHRTIRRDRRAFLRQAGATAPVHPGLPDSARRVDRVRQGPRAACRGAAHAALRVGRAEHGEGAARAP
jgi:hypothetical protein